jgi:hypothetical protein
MRCLAFLIGALLVAWSHSARADEAPLPSGAALRPSVYDVDRDADDEDEDEDKETSRENPGLLVAGILLTAAGGVTAMVGAVISVDYGCSDSMPPQCNSLAPRIVGIPVAIHGLVSLAIGVPLIAVGNERGPRRSATAPDLLVSPGGGALRWSF